MFFQGSKTGIWGLGLNIASRWKPYQIHESMHPYKVGNCRNIYAFSQSLFKKYSSNINFLMSPLEVGT